jgi:hypothetical protein
MFFCLARFAADRNFRWLNDQSVDNIYESASCECETVRVNMCRLRRVAGRLQHGLNTKNAYGPEFSANF